MKNNEIKITKLTATSLSHVLDDILIRTSVASSIDEEVIIYKSSIKTLKNVLEEIK